MKRPGRNDPCPCGSGKKFKKCCESSMIGGRFKATKIEPSSVATTAKMTSFFHSHIAPPNTTTPKPIKPISPAKEEESKTENNGKDSQ